MDSLDLVNRDPNNLNDHLKVTYLFRFFFFALINFIHVFIINISVDFVALLIFFSSTLTIVSIILMAQCVFHSTFKRVICFYSNFYTCAFF